jgi:hypothetical protein
MECPNDLNAMCDIAKTADLILLLIDGSFGFEMETFEFLNVAQTHGFPKVKEYAGGGGILRVAGLSASGSVLEQDTAHVKHTDACQ